MSELLSGVGSLRRPFIPVTRDARQDHALPCPDSKPALNGVERNPDDAGGLIAKRGERGDD
jgi:hypothetical protein